MPKFSFSSTIAQAEKEYGLGGGEYFKVKEGTNKIRILSEALPHQSFYKGNKTFKFVTWVWDYSDSKVKLYFMPVTVAKSLENLQKDPEYTFDEVPMPYDVTINVKNAGTKEVDYQLTAARQNTPIGKEVEDAFATKAPLGEVIAKLKENERNDPEKQAPVYEAPISSTDIGEVKLEDIPFN